MSNSVITKNALALSLKQLTGSMNFDKITIADITEACGLNRQTFYYHFTDKQELLYWIYNNEAFTLTRDINVHNWDQKLREFMQHMRRDRLFYMSTIKCSDDYFEEYIYKVLQELIIRAVDDLEQRGRDYGLVIQKEKLSEHEKELFASFTSHGLCGVIVDWAMNGMKENEDELADTLHDLLTRCIYTSFV